MYRKRRIVINKRGQIILAGKSSADSKGGSWIPIGLLVERDNGVVAKFLEPKNMFDRKLTDDNSLTYGGLTKACVRKVIGEIYDIVK
jgi:hypothetical protein